MAIKVGINGFGRIGRNVLRACLGSSDIEFVAVNDITDAKTLAHLLKYDSVHGRLAHSVDGREGRPGRRRQAHPRVQRARSRQAAVEGSRRQHRPRVQRPLHRPRQGRRCTSTGGAKKVIISAPAKGADLTMCYGVNHTAYRPGEHHVVSNASCTTNCLAPVAKVLHETLRHQARPDDHHPRLHQRPAHPRSAARGPAPRPRRGAVDDPDDHRRRARRRRGAARAEGQARRHGRPRADGERVGRRSDRRARARAPPKPRSTRR